MATGLCFMEDHGGGRTIVSLGTGTITGTEENRVITFDASSYPGYKQYTEDNFVIDSIAIAVTGHFYYPNGINTDDVSGTSSLTKTYDASTGTLTISGSYFKKVHYNTTPGTNANLWAAVELTPSVNLVY